MPKNHKRVGQLLNYFIMKKFVNIDILKQNELEKEEQNKVNGGVKVPPIVPPLTGVIAYPDPEEPIINPFEL